MDLLKTLYEVLGASWPRLSIFAAMSIGAFIFGGGWWLIGKQYEKERREITSTTISSAPIAVANQKERSIPDALFTKNNTEEMHQAGYACLKIVTDSLGNRNENSWGKTNGGDWSHPKNTKVHVGNAVHIIASAASINEKDSLEFKFAVQRSGSSFATRQEWSKGAEWTWNIEKGDIGRNVVVMVSIRKPKDYYQFNDADDYTYAIYDVSPQ
jgi:hypothetical protein